MRRILASFMLSGALTAGLLVAPGAAAAEPVTTNGCVTSVPDKGSTTPIQICYSLFRPAGADAANRVPLIFHSHGWGGSRSTSAADFQDWLDAGFGVLSYDQRGFGESGGPARIENPDYEGHDVAKLIALVAGLDWVQQDGPGDPRIGAIGGSYGGGYQFVGAFRQLMDRGKPVFDALAPEITWWDLRESLAPRGVPRTEWDVLLTAAGAPALPPEIFQGLAFATATGYWPHGQAPGVPDFDAFFAKNGPKWHASQGRQLDIPVLFGQGITDSLFPLTQGLKNFAGAITPAARAKSIFVGYNGGHVLPSVFPQAVGAAGDPCSVALGSDSFSDLAIRFMKLNLQGIATGLTGFGSFHLATADGACTHVPTVEPNKSYALGTVATTTAAGAPLATRIARGPVRVAGRAEIRADVTTVGVSSRAFFALAVGTTPADARIVQNNVMPFTEPLPVSGAARKFELPSVAVDVPAGQSLFMLTTPVSDMFAGMGSRTPGVMVLDNTQVLVRLV